MVQIKYSIKSIHKIIERDKPSKVCLVTSDKLAGKLAWAIKEMGIPKSQVILVPDGENAKDWTEIEKLLAKFISLDLDRKSLVIALGGGTVGDSVGFATAIYLRGVDYVQVPTTLLAQVDSAHGGKTGINLYGYKNQVGSFHLPIATIIDSRFIGSLSSEQVTDGLGEVIKSGLIKDRTILNILEKHTVQSLVKSSDLIRIIKKSIAVKEYFTSRDFNDKNIRSVLNVGHTFGHAIELTHKISHGRAVIIGIIQELKFTERLGLTRSAVRINLEKLLASLKIKIDSSLSVDWKTVLRDKKISGKKINFPVIEREGKVKLVNLKLKALMLK